MEKFTKLSKKNKSVNRKRKDILYKDDNIEVSKYDTWSIILGKDCAICIIHLIDLNKFIIRQEYIPTFKYVEGQEFHLACVGGQIEEGETPEEALLREIEEEAGIVIRDDFEIEFMKPLFMNKGCGVKCYPSIITLTENDYHEVKIEGDGSMIEKKSKTALVDVKYVNSLLTSDIVTEYVLMKFKEYLNI